MADGSSYALVGIVVEDNDGTTSVHCPNQASGSMLIAYDLDSSLGLVRCIEVCGYFTITRDEAVAKFTEFTGREPTPEEIP